MINPYRGPSIISHIQRSDSDLVRIIDNEFSEAVRANSRDIDLMIETWDSYMTLDGGQWEKTKLAKLSAELRQARSYDVIGPKVDTMAGALVSELPDMDWVPVEGERTTATDAIKDSWYADKELTNSEYEIMLTIRDGLVHCGWMQMVECQKYGKPTVGFQRILPGFLVPSPYWIHDSDNYLQAVYKIGYMTPQEMADKYRAKEYEIIQAAKDIRRYGIEELPSSAYDERRRYMGRIGDHYKIIEKHWLEHIDTTRLVGVRIEYNHATGMPTGHVRWIPFPLTSDRQQLEHFAAVQGIDWETVEEVPYTDTIHRVTTIVPELTRDVVLEDGKSRIQPKRLPFYHFTVTRYNGRCKGIVATMLDPQRTINERESLVTELIDKANGGSQLVDENIFKDDKDRERFVKNSNKPGYKHFVDFSQSKGPPIQEVKPSQYPSTLLDQIGRMYDVVVPLTSRVSDSMSAVSQSGKSGILFEREIQINRIGNLLLDKGVKQMMDNMADGYFFQWQLSYAGMQREITSRDGKRKTVLNERFVDSYGREMIRNAVGYVPRCRALVTESTRSPTYQMRYRMIFSEILQQINPQLNPEHYNYVFNKFMSTLDLPEKDKAELESINRMMDTKAKMNFVQQIMALHASTKSAGVQAAQADMQLAMIMQQLQQLGLGQQQAQPAVPEQITDATQEAKYIEQENIQPAGPEGTPPPAVGSDME